VHNGNWNNGMDHGDWGWIPMVIMMVVLVGALIWIGSALIRSNRHMPVLSAPASPTAATPSVARFTAQEILAERLARGEIEPDDYRQRLEALRSSTNS
jgi:putative membrane protein